MNLDPRRFIEKRLLTTQEVPAVTVQQWASRHKVAWVLKGRTYLFDRKDFEDFERPGTAGVPGRKSKVFSEAVEQGDISADPQSAPYMPAL